MNLIKQVGSSDMNLTKYRAVHPIMNLIKSPTCPPHVIPIQEQSGSGQIRNLISGSGKICETPYPAPANFSNQTTGSGKIFQTKYPVPAKFLKPYIRLRQAYPRPTRGANSRFKTQKISENQLPEYSKILQPPKRRSADAKYKISPGYHENQEFSAI